MPNYEINGKGKNTGRKRKRIYFASSEMEARQLAEDDGMLAEEVIELPPEPPTERQLEYAKGLGISIPPNATKNDLSDLISIKVEKDKPSTERHRTFAKAYGIEITDYIGKKALFDRIQAALVAPGREKELLSWFSFRVYRELANGADNAPIERPDDPIIEAIAEQLIIDEKIINSVRRYQGRELIWFGEWTSPDGYVHTGGSNRTEAYKRVSSMLKERASFPTRPQKMDSSAPIRSQNKKAATQPKGCLSVILVVIAIPVGIVVYAVWLEKIFV
jgi:hypothetical protein